MIILKSFISGFYLFYVFKAGYADNGNDNGNETFRVRSYYTVASCSHHSMLGKYPGWFVTTHHYIAPLSFPYCTARQCSKIYGVLYNQASSVIVIDLFNETVLFNHRGGRSPPRLLNRQSS